MVPTIRFDDLIQTSELPVLVDFWAEWCAPCRMIGPVVKQVAKAYSGRLITIKINVDKRPAIARRYHVQSIPTLILFRRGQAIMRITGARSFEQLSREIESHLPG